MRSKGVIVMLIYVMVAVKVKVMVMGLIMVMVMVMVLASLVINSDTQSPIGEPPTSDSCLVLPFRRRRKIVLR